MQKIEESYCSILIAALSLLGLMYLEKHTQVKLTLK